MSILDVPGRYSDSEDQAGSGVFNRCWKVALQKQDRTDLI